MINMFLSNNPSLGDINLSNLPCFFMEANNMNPNQILFASCSTEN